MYPVYFPYSPSSHASHKAKAGQREEGEKEVLEACPYVIRCHVGERVLAGRSPGGERSGAGLGRAQREAEEPRRGDEVPHPRFEGT